MPGETNCFFFARQYVKTKLLKSHTLPMGKYLLKTNRDKKHMIHTKEDLEVCGSLPPSRSDSTSASAIGP